MSDTFGEWLKAVPPAKALIGLCLMIASGAFGLGVFADTFTGVPRQVDALADTVAVVRDTQLDVLDRLDRDSTQLWRIECIVRRTGEGEVLGPLDCDPGGRDE